MKKLSTRIEKRVVVNLAISAVTIFYRSAANSESKAIKTS